MRDRAPDLTPRLFVAIPVPDPVRDAVAKLLEPIRAATDRPTHRIRWVRMDGLHLTLRFFGHVPVSAADVLAAAVDEVVATAAPFRIRLAGGGAFPRVDAPRTLWLGVGEGAAEAARLATALGVTLARDGWPDDDRPFRPHLTIARTDGAHGAAEAARRIVEAAAGWEVAFTADRLTLYRSHLGGGPARYEALHDAPLVAPAAAAG